MLGGVAWGPVAMDHVFIGLLVAGPIVHAFVLWPLVRQVALRLRGRRGP